MKTSSWIYHSSSKGPVRVEEMHPLHIANAKRKLMREIEAKGIDTMKMGDLVSLSVEANRRGMKNE